VFVESDERRSNDRDAAARPPFQDELSQHHITFVSGEEPSVFWKLSAPLASDAYCQH
jgi:hypothetical protein